MSQWDRYTIDGPAGALEVAVGQAEGEARRIAVICHPHPLYGGTLDNKVAYTVARAAEQSGLISVRFNFRSVGDSEGLHDGGAGELDDALAVVEHARQQFNEQPLLMAGFSFGGWVSLHAASRCDPAQLVTVAPALSYTALGGVPRLDCPWFYIHGEADDVIAASDNRKTLASLDKPPEQLWLPEVGHFFHGHLTELREQVSQAIVARWAALP